MQIAYFLCWHDVKCVCFGLKEANKVYIDQTASEELSDQSKLKRGFKLSLGLNELKEV